MPPEHAEDSSAEYTSPQALAALQAWQAFEAGKGWDDVLETYLDALAASPQGRSVLTQRAKRGKRNQERDNEQR